MQYQQDTLPLTLPQSTIYHKHIHFVASESPDEVGKKKKKKERIEQEIMNAMVLIEFDTHPALS